jgi:putative ABC transport system ATP-binding protein
MPESLPALAVRCREVFKTYGAGAASVPALRGVNLVVNHGELLMLVGPSGCGKTTLISIVAAILDPDAGQCEVPGQDIRSMDKKDKIHFRGKSIGFVFQLFNLLPALTAEENVAVPLLLNGFPRRDTEDRARLVLDSVGLGNRMNAMPAQLSGAARILPSERHRLTFVMVTANPEVMPTVLKLQPSIVFAGR